MLTEAFFAVCDEAQPAKGSYVSLYRSDPYYGGPEEGGWWGEDTTLVAYQHYPAEIAAEAALEQVKLLADEQNKQERKAYGEHCLRQTEWLEARGLDDDFLPEPDGETNFFAVVEENLGCLESRGNRYYS